MSVQLHAQTNLYKQLFQSKRLNQVSNTQYPDIFEMSPQTQYIIPDLLVTWPWKRAFNTDLADVKDEANDWVTSLDLFEASQLKKFHACDFSN